MLRDPRKEEPHNDNHCICAVRYLLDVQSSGTQYTPLSPHWSHKAPMTAASHAHRGPEGKLAAFPAAQVSNGEVCVSPLPLRQCPLYNSLPLSQAVHVAGPLHDVQ
jgi:hypothetical protein